MNITNKTMFQVLSVCLTMLACATNAHSALVTFDFEGEFTSTGSLFNYGDTFAGSYTFESTVTPSLHPDNSLDIQALAIDSSLVGTGWSIDVFSSAIDDFSVYGTRGTIAVGDDTFIGDRYITTLTDNGGLIPLPGGISLNFFQIDLQDPLSTGSDMLSDGLYQSLPDLSAASHVGGRFFTAGDTGGCAQCSVTFTSLSVSPVPEPSTLFLFGAGLGFLALRRKKLVTT